MYIKDVIEGYKGKKISIYVDMDGVIADYDVGKPSDYHKKRPLYSNIKLLEEISKMPNVEMHILSISRMNEGVSQKEEWLDKYAPFFFFFKRNIIPREKNDFTTSIELKVNYMKSVNSSDKVIILIDDDPSILHALRDEGIDICLLKDTTLIY